MLKRVESEDTQKVTIRIDRGVYEYAKRASIERGENLALFIQTCIARFGEVGSIDMEKLVAQIRVVAASPLMDERDAEYVARQYFFPIFGLESAQGSGSSELTRDHADEDLQRLYSDTLPKEA